MKEKIDSLQAVRAMAFLAVLLTHCEIVPNLGGWGVSVFIVMSGFLMSYRYFDRVDKMNISLIDNAKFAIKKIKKLYPLHIIMMLVTLPIVFVQMHLGRTLITVRDVITQLILHVTLTQTLIPIEKYYFSLNGLSWYLSVSMFLYFAFPWILKKIKNCSDKYLVGLSLNNLLIIGIAVVCAQIVFGNDSELRSYFNYVCPLLRVFDFSIGCNFGVLFLRNKGKISSKKATFFEVITVALIALSIWFLNHNWDVLVLKILSHSVFLYAPTSIALVYLFAEKKGLISRAVSNKLFIWIGNISPYGYLIHQKVIAYLIILFVYCLKVPLNAYLRTVLAIMITLVLIYCYLYMEKKSCKLLKLAKHKRTQS